MSIPYIHEMSFMSKCSDQCSTLTHTRAYRETIQLTQFAELECVSWACAVLDLYIVVIVCFFKLRRCGLWFEKRMLLFAANTYAQRVVLRNKWDQMDCSQSKLQMPPTWKSGKEEETDSIHHYWKLVSKITELHVQPDQSTHRATIRPLESYTLLAVAWLLYPTLNYAKYHGHSRRNATCQKRVFLIRIMAHYQPLCVLLHRSFCRTMRGNF